MLHYTPQCYIIPHNVTLYPTMLHYTPQCYIIPHNACLAFLPQIYANEPKKGLHTETCQLT